MLYTEAFKGTAHLYVGEDFSGGEDAFLCSYGGVTLPFPFILQCKPSHTYTHGVTQTQM